MDTLSWINTKYKVPDGAKMFYLNGLLRIDLYHLFKELGFTLGCEVGVCKGPNARNMLDIIPNLKLHCVDCWSVVSGKKRWSQKRQKSYYLQMKRNLKPYRENGQAHIIKKYSMEAVGDFENNSLDFVYIDARHEFDWVMRDIIEWSKKVRKDGIISGHDYYKSSRFGVVVAVNAYVKAHKIKPWFLMDKEQQSSRSQIVRNQNSWFFVKRKEF